MRRVKKMWTIRGRYLRQPWETIDIVETRKEALELLAEYRVAFGSEWQLNVKKGEF